MKYISWEESLNYVPLEDQKEISFQDCKYYTFIYEDEWEIVKYFTGRRYDRFDGINSEGTHWVYILENNSMPGLYKVGFTKDDVGPEKRSKQVSRSSGVPTPFSVKWAFKCFDGMALEQQVHKRLSYARVNNDREFFSEKFEIIKETIETLGKNFTKHD